MHPRGGGAGSALLVEREAHLVALTSSLEATARGEGSLLVITGAAGIGKSFLAAAAAARGRELGLTVRSARGSEIEQGFSFGIVRQLFERVVTAAPADERQRLLSGAAAGAARLFADAPVDPAGASAGDGGFATLHGIYWLTAGMAAERPLMLVVDDVHWADAPSLRALGFLASRVVDLPVVLVVTIRTQEHSANADLVAELESHPNAQRLDLSALGPEGVAAIVRAQTTKADDALCNAFYGSSAGNPLYVRELIRSVDWRHGLPTAEVVQQTAVASVGERVMRRVAALGADAPRVAAAMAVLGAHGQLHDAAAVAEQDEQDAARVARAMCRAEILGNDDPFEWIHPVVRRSVYDSLSVTDRDSLHARAADVLAAEGASPDAVAAHLSALRPANAVHVTDALVAAADHALARDAPEVAIGLLRRAIDEGAPQPPRAELLLRMGQIQVTARDPEAESTLREALALSDEPRLRALATMAIMESYVFEGRWDAAAEMSERVLDDTAGLDQELILELELGRALVCMFDPELVHLFEDERARLQELAKGDSWPARALSAALAMMDAQCGRDLGQVGELCAHAVGEGVLIAERGAGAYASGHVLAALIAIEALDRAHEFAERVEAAARAQGSIANRFVAKGYLGRLTVLQGNMTEGEESMRPLVETAVQNGMALLVVFFLWWMLEVIVERPSTDDLVGLVESIELPPTFADAAGGAWVFRVRGQLRAMRGERDLAEQDLRRAAGIFERLGFGPTHIPYRSALALVLGPKDADEAQLLVAHELEAARRSGLSRPIGIALRAQGLLLGGDEGIERLRESVRVLADTPWRYEEARSLVELGSLLRRSGRRADSRQPLSAGLELAHHCGAERLFARARDELLASGARPRKTVPTGLGALTASERRIVRLAAQGRTNPEIAQELYVSVKTVETHLSSAYRTLGLAGQGARRNLPELVAHADQVAGV